MDSSQILTITVFVIVITIVGTIALAVVGYLAFRLRDRKHPSGPEFDRPPGKPYFFERIGLPQPDDDAADETGDDTEQPALPEGRPVDAGELPAGADSPANDESGDETTGR